MIISWAIPVFKNPKTGAERVFNNLLEILRKHGAGIHFTYREWKNQKGLLRKIWINVVNCFLLLKLPRRAYIFQNYYTRAEFVLANIILRIMARKIILFVHEIYDISQFSCLKKSALKIINYITFKPCALIVVNSNFTKNWVCSFGNFSKKVFLMYPILPVLNSKPSTAVKICGPDPIVLCIGNIRKNKGQLILLQALENVQHDMNVIFVGGIKDRNYYLELQNYIDSNNLGDRVQFTGFLDPEELTSLYSSVDIVVSPTLKEGFGMAVYEAMYCGKCVISTAVGGIVEQIDDGVNGFLAPPENEYALAEKITLCAGNQKLRDDVGERARARASQFPSLDQQAQELYKQLEGQ